MLNFNNFLQDGEGTNVIKVPFSENNDTLQYVVTELEIYTLYNITVTAFTAVGAGENATIRSKTLQDSEFLLIYFGSY